MQTMKQTKGFTLIETLLVLTVMSVVIVVSFSVLQRKAESNKVANTVKVIQQIANASRAYYNQEGNWPTQMSDLYEAPASTRTTLNPLFLPAPIKGHVYSNAWGDAIKINNHGLITHSPKLKNLTPNYLTLTTIVPKGYGDAIAAQLPLARVATVGKLDRVSSFVAIPAQSSNYAPNQVQTMQVHQITAGSTWSVKMPSCENSNYVPSITYGIESFGSMNGQGSLLTNSNVTCTVSGGNYNISLQNTSAASLSVGAIDSTDANITATTLSTPNSDSSTTKHSADGDLVHGDLYDTHDDDKAKDVWYVTSKEEDSNKVTNQHDPNAFIAEPGFHGVSMQLNNTNISNIAVTQTQASAADNNGWVYAITRCVPPSQVVSNCSSSSPNTTTLIAKNNKHDAVTKY